jgi:hypothetical protein
MATSGATLKSVGSGVRLGLAVAGVREALGVEDVCGEGEVSEGLTEGD